MENKELFNNKTKEQPAQRQPMQLGLYDATNEHDACGDCFFFRKMRKTGQPS